MSPNKTPPGYGGLSPDIHGRQLPCNAGSFTFFAAFVAKGSCVMPAFHFRIQFLANSTTDAKFLSYLFT